MNISNLLKFKTTNVEAATAEVEANSGTFKNLLEKVYDGTISALVNNKGDIIGINYATDGSVDDNIEQAKFMKQYQCKPVYMWANKAFEIYQNNDSYDDVIEDDKGIKVILNNGEEIIVDGYNEVCRDTDLPESMDIGFDDDDYEGFDYMDNPEKTMHYIKKYLRNTFGHYLSGFDGDPTYEIDLDNELIHVSDIHWGRKI